MNSFVKIILFVLLSQSAQAQSKEKAAPFMNNGYIGYSNFIPNLKRDFEPVDSWSGLEFTFGDLVFSYNSGSLRNTTSDSTYASPSAYLFKVGYRLGKEFSIGENSIASMSIKPYIQVSGATSSIPNVILDDNIASAGLVFSPGIVAKFSHVYFNIQYDAGLHFNIASGFNKEYNLNRGLLTGLQFTVGIENGYDLLYPAMYTLRGYDIETKTNEKYLGTSTSSYNGSSYDTWLISTVTKKTPGQMALCLMAPFWGVGPSYSFSPRKDRRAATSMMGVNAGGRFSYFMLDGFFETGTLGSVDNTDRNDLTVNYPQLRDFDFSAQVNTTQFGGRVGFNVARALSMLNFEPDAESSAYASSRVTFLQVHLMYSFGKAFFEGAPSYSYEGAKERLADFQSVMGISPSAENNPEYIPSSSNFSGIGGSLQIGSAFFHLAKYNYKDAPVLNHVQMTVGANIPVVRVFGAFRTKRFFNNLGRSK